MHMPLAHSERCAGATTTYWVGQKHSFGFSKHLVEKPEQKKQPHPHKSHFLSVNLRLLDVSHKWSCTLRDVLWLVTFTCHVTFPLVRLYPSWSNTCHTPSVYSRPYLKSLFFFDHEELWEKKLPSHRMCVSKLNWGSRNMSNTFITESFDMI